jgi:2-keto-4-pentenoate hydratase
MDELSRVAMEDMDAAIGEVADALAEAARSRQPIPPIRGRLPADNLDAAYAVQRINTDRRREAGQTLSGRKVGLTSLAVQKQLGVGEPDFGLLFQECAYGDGEPIPWSRVIQPRCEAEIALVMDRDLLNENVTLPQLMRAIAYVLPAIEIVDSRIAGWDINILDTVADNASAGLYVLGASPVRLGDLDLRLAGMVMEREGQSVSLGVGAACLGHPLNSALWAARTLARAGVPLIAGEVLLTGALGPMVGANPGEQFDVTIQGLGRVRARFGRDANQTP